jgi:hypothetical protein
MHKILDALAAGNFHEPLEANPLRAMGVGLPSDEDYQALQEEVRYIMAHLSPSHVASKGHGTNWTKPVGQVRQWSLFNTHRDTSNTSDDFNYHNIPDKRPVPGYSFLGKMCRTLPSLVNMRLNAMSPGGALSPHEEHLPIAIGSDKVAFRCRFHLPVFTNPESVMLADGDLFHFQGGKVYAFNNGCIHSAKNDGGSERVHLVWDQLMTERAIQAMFDGDRTPSWLISAVQPINPVGHLDVTKFQPSGGMKRQEFDRRRVVFHPGV